jgi:Zn finger protein HypA/HybF involved in hydrogenase expression
MHESDGAVPREKVALKVECRSCGRVYRHELGKDGQACPKCGCKEYDTLNELYE